MIVYYKLSGWFKNKLSNFNLKKPEGKVEVDEKASVRAVLNKLGINDNLSMFILVNNKPAAKDYICKEGDKIKLVPLVGGV